MSLRHGLEIRAAQPSDAPALAELLGYAPSLARRIEALRASQGTALLALEWGPPSGVIALHWHATLTDDQPVAYVSTFLVAEQARRRGIGRLLIKAAAQSARAAGCARLTLSAPQPAGDLHLFCIATGFTQDNQNLFSRNLRRGG